MDFKNMFNKITIQSTLITLGFILISLAAYFIPLPFINQDVMSLVLEDIQRINELSARSNFSMFILGIQPFLICFLGVKAISWVIRKINKKEENKKYILIATSILTSIMIIIQSLGITLYLKSFKYYGETVQYLVSPNVNLYLFMALGALSFLVGSFSLIFLAYKLNKKLILNGFILLFFLQSSVVYGPDIVKTITSFYVKTFTTAKQYAYDYSSDKGIISYQLKEEILKKPEQLKVFDENIKAYLSGLDKAYKYKRNGNTIAISAKKSAMDKVRIDFSEQHSLDFLGETAESISLSKKIVENAKNLPEQIAIVKTSYPFEVTGEKIDDYYFKTNSASKEDKKILDAYLKTIELPKTYKFYCELVYSKEKSHYRTYLLKDDLRLSGLSIKEVQALVDPRSNSPYVALAFNDEGRKLLADITEKIKGHRLAIVIDKMIDSAPIVQESIRGGRANISLGVDTYDEKVEKAEKLKRNIETSRFLSYIKQK